MAVLTLQPDETAGFDTWIRDSDPTTERSTSAVITVGERIEASENARGIIKFDLSSIPSGSTISSAVLTLTVNSELSSNARTLSAFRILRPVTEVATWNTYDGSNGWGTNGCANTTSDREATDIGTVSIDANPSVGAAYNLTLTASKVKEWVDGTLTNNGILLKVDTETDDQVNYESSSSSTANIRPKLVVNYIPAASFMAMF